MICNNCQKVVDDDLVFCTECGARLHETLSQTPTVLINDPVVTQKEITTHPKSNLKWFVLLAALIALPISIFGLYLLLNLRKQPLTPNANKQTTPNVSPNKKTNTNRTNLNANTNGNSNSSWTNSTPISNSENNDTNTDVNSSTSVVMWKERIEIAPDSHYAIPFELEQEGTIVGKVVAVNGSPIEGYVYFQQQFDEHFPDPDFKMFSFGGEKKAETKQHLLKENYVLVFVNKSEASVTIDGEFKIIYNN
ncbi:MAG TPA: hypothetical protein PKY82_14470 [Pyrinomonadaceae bacterium]|nr:hypothetical protein [Pyrinomonadaceae bacterium]